MNKLVFNAVDQKIQNATDIFGLMMEIIAKSFGKRENPLTNRRFRENVVNQMSCDLCHMACVARWTNASSFAGKGD
ncbi:MAG: hypothetical protein A3E26_02425 [Chlamydiae bacterium RIFCSPHIGHO2_12_FULL_49_32]|nr:MAG: hypothetical protein A3D18_05055 [Chlamydiae bacterium RIFCSPHIGHO2_02_FULL_49_29]OGN63693.1 MAG: hypothetical protein A3E26_02425 [Chlamydiae bacterium RIFCSPHIGHO2_12_FULL_49_32]